MENAKNFNNFSEIQNIYLIWIIISCQNNQLNIIQHRNFRKYWINWPQLLYSPQSCPIKDSVWDRSVVRNKTQINSLSLLMQKLTSKINSSKSISNNLLKTVRRRLKSSESRSSWWTNKLFETVFVISFKISF